MPFSDILNDEIDPESPITTSLMNRLRDNPLVRDLQVFSTPGSFTWTRPEGCNGAIVICVGGGGGGAGRLNSASGNGSNGGSSSFGSFFTSGGGSGGNRSSILTPSGGSVVTGTFSPQIAINGQKGFYATASGGVLDPFLGGSGGSSFFGSGGMAGSSNDSSSGTGFGSGGGGCSDTSQAPERCHGGASGATAIAFISSGITTDVSVTVGAGGSGGSSGGGNGAGGVVAVYSLFDVQAAF